VVSLGTGAPLPASFTSIPQYQLSFCDLWHRIRYHLEFARDYIIPNVFGKVPSVLHPRSAGNLHKIAPEASSFGSISSYGSPLTSSVVRFALSSLGGQRTCRRYLVATSSVNACSAAAGSIAALALAAISYQEAGWQPALPGNSRRLVLFNKSERFNYKIARHKPEVSGRHGYGRRWTPPEAPFG
jgi:hypothetical protein